MRIVLGAILFALLMPAMALGEELRLAYEDYPPYEFFENNTVKGTHIDLIEEVGRRLDLDLVYFKEPFARALYDAKSGVVDGVFSLFKTPERMEFLYYPAEPLSETTTALVTRSHSGVKFSGLDDLLKYPIGAVRGYSHSGGIETLQGLYMSEVTDNGILLRMLDEGRIKIALCTLDSFKYQHGQAGYDWEIKILKVLKIRPLFIGFPKILGERSQRLAQDFDRELKNIKAGK